jgi:hypothetical protein
VTVPPDVLLTGFASVSAHGPRRGLPALDVSGEPGRIERWPTPGARRAYLVPPFRPADLVPGLNTRRMDRLSAWALLCGRLALQDAGLEGGLERDRTAVVVGTAFGCLDLTEEFLGTLAANAWQAPPIVFPETLSNLPASHLARQLGIRGPNLTLSAGAVSGEAALLQAVSLLQAGEADRALVLAGDVLTRAVFEWYEAAGMLAPACFGGTAGASPAGRRRIVPGEGLAACVLERRDGVEARGARAYGRHHAVWVGPRPAGPGETESLLRGMLGGLPPHEVLLVAAATCGPSWMVEVAGLHQRQGVEFGELGGCGLLQLGVALAHLGGAEETGVLVAGPADPLGQAAALLMTRPEGR